MKWQTLSKTLKNWSPARQVPFWVFGVVCMCKTRDHYPLIILVNFPPFFSKEKLLFYEIKSFKNQFVPVW